MNNSLKAQSDLKGNDAFPILSFTPDEGKAGTIITVTVSPAAIPGGSAYNITGAFIDKSGTSYAAAASAHDTERYTEFNMVVPDDLEEYSPYRLRISLSSADTEKSAKMYQFESTTWFRYNSTVSYTTLKSVIPNRISQPEIRKDKTLVILGTNLKPLATSESLFQLSPGNLKLRFLGEKSSGIQLGFLRPSLPPGPGRYKIIATLPGGSKVISAAFFIITEA